ncbi:MAG: MBL fold metallo-hydrolase [Pseudohongiellaceae bacterium]
MATITFYGAAQQVTGSCYLLESPSFGRLLMECGMRQGGDAVHRVENTQFRFEPESLDGVILSHAHLDHSGLLPRLVQAGFDGPIYCTPATQELLRIMLEDAWGLYERDLEFENRRRQRRGRKVLQPQYNLDDVKRVLKLCHTLPYRNEFELAPGTRLRFLDAGHILGAAIVELCWSEKGESRRLVFSGDLGNKDSVLMNDPEQPTEADLVMMEGTYGNRNHRSMTETMAEFRDVLASAWRRGGNVMIPSFAVGRTQEIIFHLGRLHQDGELDDWQVFLDSPMAIEVTHVYDNWLQIMDSGDVHSLTSQGRESLANFLPTLKLTRTPEESMAINRIKQGALIIAGSGMCTGGRIRHHFKHRIWDERNTVIFAGFQAQGTLGRLLVDGRKDIRMFGEKFKVKAEIATLGGFSAHAGQTELIDWAKNFQPPPRLLLVHGEAGALQILSSKLSQDLGLDSEIPAEGHTIEI